MNANKSYYLIGLCGIGMSSLAQLIKSSGYNVRGSDLNPDPDILNILNSLGIQVFKGHSKGRITNEDIVVYSTAIDEDNPEYQEAKSLNLTLLHRTKALKEFLSGKRIFSVTGTHGKTTTTYMLAKGLREVGFEVGMLIGGIPQDFGNNFIKADSVYILELDESDGSFLDLESEIKVITSLDMDHLEFYRVDFSVLKSKFLEYLNKNGLNIICWDDLNLRELVVKSNIKHISFGFQDGAMYRGKILDVGESGTKIRLFLKGNYIRDVKISLLGYKIAVNCLSLFALGDILGLNLNKLADALSSFKSVKRRYEIKFSSLKLKVIEDYGHHPSEIEEVIKTIKGYLKPKRLIVVFQPHRYSRTKFLWSEFKNCFRGADLLILTDIYSAFEKEIPTVSAQRLAQEIKGIQVLYLPLWEISEELLKVIKEGDIITVLGAGNINKICQPLVDELKTWV